MCLVLVEVKSGDCAVVVDDEADMVVVSSGADVVPESSSMAAQVWGGELDFGDDPEVVRDVAGGDPEGYLQVCVVEDCSG